MNSEVQILKFFKDNGTLPDSRHVLEHNIEIPVNNNRIKETYIFGTPAIRNTSLKSSELRWKKV